MKRIKTIMLCLIIILFTCSCESKLLKTEYFINEKANIDDIEITLTKASFNETKQLDLVFEIKNLQDNTITITPDNNFKFYEKNLQLSNTYQTTNTIIKSNDVSYITLNYPITDYDKEIYDIYFYSGVVENNIKFIINKNNITS